MRIFISLLSLTSVLFLTSCGSTSSVETQTSAGLPPSSFVDACSTAASGEVNTPNPQAKAFDAYSKALLGFIPLDSSVRSELEPDVEDWFELSALRRDNGFEFDLVAVLVSFIEFTVVFQIDRDQMLLLESDQLSSL